MSKISETMTGAKDKLHEDLKKVADKIKEGSTKVAFFCGAGISTGAGIPDFRSPETGLYANLKRLNLPFPEAVFDIEFFRNNPRPFYTLADELYPGKFFPTKFHFMISLFEKKGILKRVYTQNIDTLERLAGVSSDFIVEAHGSFAANHCIDCNTELSAELFKAGIDDKTNGGIPRCLKCKGYVKPDIVFFGEALPTRFFELWEQDCDDIDVAIVAGTSLTVFPFASLPSEVDKSSTRLLVNNVVVGDFKRPRKNDFVAIENCDTVTEVLIEQLGWQKEFQEFFEAKKKEFHSKEGSLASAKKLSEKIAEEVKDEEYPSGLSSGEKEESNQSSIIDELEIEISKIKISSYASQDSLTLKKENDSKGDKAV